MKTYTPEQLAEILRLHALWLKVEGGERANLSGANLRSADLSGADLSGANLYSANLSETRGIQYAQAAFTDHGERGRMLTLAAIDGAKRFFCGCFQGTPEDLAEYIAKGPHNLKKSRLLAMNFCLEAIDTVNI